MFSGKWGRREIEGRGEKGEERGVGRGERRARRDRRERRKRREKIPGMPSLP